MTGTILSTYLAYLLQTGVTPAPVRVVHAPPKAAPVVETQQIVIETETRGSMPTIKASQSTGTRVAAEMTADDVVDQVQKFYADIKQVGAKFRQTITNATFGKTTTQDGKVLIKKPGKMRWDYYAKKKKGDKKSTTTKTFISNGTYLYVVDHQNKQVIEKNLEKNMLPVAITFLYGKGDLKTDFTASLDTSNKYNVDSADFVLKLTPKETSAQYKYLYLVVDSGNFRVKKSVIIDSSKNVNQFQFFEPDFDSTVKDSLFKFNKDKVPNYRITTDDDSDDDKADKDKGDKTE